MAQKFYGSIDITNISEQMKKGHSAFSRADNKHIYANIVCWFNDEKDKYGNRLAIQLSPTPEKAETDKNPYIGNCRLSEPKALSEEQGARAADEFMNDLPF